MLYLKDPSGTLTFADVTKKNIPWEKVSRESVNFGYTSSAYWFAFTLDNTSGDNYHCYLALTYPLLDYIELYVPDDRDSYTLKKTGDRHPFSRRDVEDRNFLFTIDLAQGKSTLYLRVHTSSSLTFSALLWSPLGYINRMNRDLPLTWIYFGLLIVMAAYNIFLFASVREPEYIYYALFIFFWVLFQLTLLGYSFQYLWPDSIWWANSSLPFFMCVTMLWVAFFGRSYINTPAHFRLVDRLLIYTGIVPLAACALVSLVIHYSLAIKLATAMTIYYSLGLYSLIIYMTIKKNRQAMFIAIGFALLMVGLIFFTFKSFGLIPSTVVTRHSIQFGISALVILLSLGMADKINMMKSQLQDLNVNLEKKVLARTDELNAAMEELEAMNENLLAANEELEQAQDMINRDMAMAGNMQKKFFPETPPGTSNWEAAFYFRPMTGVSGDLYDFYISGDQLQGLSLFDVSGHGVASGLITMLAKSILFRNFHDEAHRDLNQIMAISNLNLIKEIGDLGNYLTGIMLRFAGDDVQYVNAGHPDLLHRSTDGRVRTVRDENNDAKGSFLGIKIMEDNYGMITFPAEKGDSLLLFTDCLMETADREGREFGVEGIAAALREAPRASAAEELDYVMKQFSLYHENTVIFDDLTVILVKKIS
jgi:serine phosphatase RsbU (regulator of sigma subunit)